MEICWHINSQLLGNVQIAKISTVDSCNQLFFSVLLFLLQGL